MTDTIIIHFEKKNPMLGSNFQTSAYTMRNYLTIATVGGSRNVNIYFEFCVGYFGSLIFCSKQIKKTLVRFPELYHNWHCVYDYFILQGQYRSIFNVIVIFSIKSIYF